MIFILGTLKIAVESSFPEILLPKITEKVVRNPELKQEQPKRPKCCYRETSTIVHCMFLAVTIATN